MKKLIATAVIAIVFVSVLCVFSGCGSEVPTYDDTELYYEIESLKDRIENLENKNNVFWTDKAEYSETETMMVYFKDTAVYEIRLDGESTASGKPLFVTGKNVISASIAVKCLQVDTYSGSFLESTFIFGDNVKFIKTSTSGTNILLPVGVEKSLGASYEGDENAVVNGSSYDYVICVPGTPFELARFVNVSIEK